MQATISLLGLFCMADQHENFCLSRWKVLGTLLSTTFLPDPLQQHPQTVIRGQGSKCQGHAHEAITRFSPLRLRHSQENTYSKTGCRNGYVAFPDRGESEASHNWMVLLNAPTALGEEMTWYARSMA